MVQFNEILIKLAKFKFTFCNYIKVNAGGEMDDYQGRNRGTFF